MAFGRVWATVTVAALTTAGCGRAVGPDGEAVVNAPALRPVEAIEPGSGAVDQSPSAPVVQLQEPSQPAVWPAADVVFATPEEAAADFVSNVLISEGEPLLGDFEAGDARSGEIAVLFGGETGDADPPLDVGTLLLRQLGPADGWFVIAAVSDGATIDAPTSGADIGAGPLTVSGEGRGFEGTLVVSAFPPGDAATVIDREIGAGGATADLEPYSVTLDLSGATPGETVAIVVQGGTGIGSDPGTFAAVPVVVAAEIPATR